MFTNTHVFTYYKIFKPLRDFPDKIQDPRKFLTRPPKGQIANYFITYYILKKKRKILCIKTFRISHSDDVL